MAKATVQAALGPVCLKRLSPNNTDEERQHADIVLMVCILSIVVTAPIGAILISISGPRLLTKTKQAPPTEGLLFHLSLCLSFHICSYIRMFYVVEQRKVSTSKTFYIIFFLLHYYCYYY